MTLSLPPLPYDFKALEPHISAQTLHFHYEKHHQTYVTNLNRLLDNHALKSHSLEEIIHASYPEKGAIFNNAAQVWNHTFYWNCMTPKGGGKPGTALYERLTKDFGSFDAFCKEFKEAALTQFGSGWAWLVEKDNTLQIMKTSNADLPMVHKAKALLTIDVWEHAYYLDYQNKRADYIDMFLTHLVHWDFVEKQCA